MFCPQKVQIIDVFRANKISNSIPGYTVYYKVIDVVTISKEDVE